MQHAPAVALRGQYGAATDPLQESLAGLMLGLDMACSIEMGSALRSLPIKFNTVRKYAGELLMA